MVEEEKSEEVGRKPRRDGGELAEQVSRREDETWKKGL